MRATIDEEEGQEEEMMTSSTTEVPVNMNARATSALSASGASKASSGWSNIMARTLHLADPVASPHYCLTADNDLSLIDRWLGCTHDCCVSVSYYFVVASMQCCPGLQKLKHL